MHLSRVAETLAQNLYAAGMPRRSPIRLSSAVVMGFDAEWDADTGALLSHQLVVTGADGMHGEVLMATEPRLTLGRLYQTVLDLLDDVGVSPPARTRGRGAERREVHVIYLIAHFAQAELSVLEDALKDCRITQIQKAHHATLEPWKSDSGRLYEIRIIDLFAFYATSLKRVGDMIGLPKLEADRERLSHLMQHDPAAFHDYAIRDAEIALKAFSLLREAAWTDWQVELLATRTIASLGAAIFRHRFLRTEPVPSEVDLIRVRVRNGSGWIDKTRERRRYSGDLRLREMAAKAYWGGRVESYIRGLYRGPVVERDVTSLYPYAAISQPLPNADTVWRETKCLNDINSLEGFGTVEFRFPRDFDYPCLPTVREDQNKLLFPSTGISHCTFAEMRVAQSQGAQLRLQTGWGFLPTKAEREHDPGVYLKHFLAEKERLEKGTLDYETAKLLLNSLIGKFFQLTDSSRVLEFEREALQRELPGLVSTVAGSLNLRDGLKGPLKPGALYIPEWATLTLGRARAVMATIIPASEALLVSTDSVIGPPVEIQCSGLSELHAVGSGLTEEVRGDALFSSRTRLYAVLEHGEGPSGFTVVRAARHGSIESHEDFSETVLRCIAAGKYDAPLRNRRRLAGAERAAREGLRINAEVDVQSRTKFEWDKKRRLLNRDVNPFRGLSKTKPYYSLGKADEAEHQRLLRKGLVRRRRREHSSRKLRAIVRDLAMGVGVREVSRRYDVPKSTVSDLKKKLQPELDKGKEQS